MITTSIAAKMLGVHPQTIRRLIHDNKIAAIETEGGKYRVFQSSVESYLASRIVSSPDSDKPQK